MWNLASSKSLVNLTAFCFHIHSQISLETSYPGIWKTQTKETNKTPISALHLATFIFVYPDTTAPMLLWFCFFLSLSMTMSSFSRRRNGLQKMRWKSTGNTFGILANAPLLKIKKKEREGITAWATKCAGFYTAVYKRCSVNLRCKLHSGCPPTAFCTLSVTAVFWHALQNSWTKLWSLV